MPRFQVSNEKLEDLAISGPYSHTATLAAPFGWAGDLSFAVVLPLSINPRRGGDQLLALLFS